MSISERIIDGITILDLTGRLTYSSGIEMGRRVRHLSDAGSDRIVLNLALVSYVDSAGLGSMIESFTWVQQQGGALKLLNPTARTKYLLEITGLSGVVTTFESEPAVVASFAA